MGKKKKKMTPAQAAAARRDDGRKRKASTVTVKDNGPTDRGNRLVLGVTIAMVALVVVLSVVFTAGPLGMAG